MCRLPGAVSLAVAHPRHPRQAVRGDVPVALLVVGERVVLDGAAAALCDPYPNRLVVVDAVAAQGGARARLDNNRRVLGCGVIADIVVLEQPPAIIGDNYAHDLVMVDAVAAQG